MLRKSSFHKTGRRGTVALTFDDGPHPKYTPELLDALRQSGVLATFFVLSTQAKLHVDIIQRMIDEGHDVQIHGSRHWFVPLLHPLAAKMQCFGAARTMKQLFGITCDVYRPTWGACNLATLLWVRLNGMKLCTWSVMVGDWRVTDSEVLVRRIEDKLTDEAIIVLHDSDVTLGAEAGAPASVITAIPQIVERVSSRGLKFVKISDCV